MKNKLITLSDYFKSFFQTIFEIVQPNLNFNYLKTQLFRKVRYISVKSDLPTFFQNYLELLYFFILFCNLEKGFVIFFHFRIFVFRPIWKYLECGGGKKLKEFFEVASEQFLFYFLKSNIAWKLECRKIEMSLNFVYFIFPQKS